LKFGTLTFQPHKPKGFDIHVYRVKPETGLRLQPIQDMASNIAVFADTQTGQEHPEWISQSPLGQAKFGNNNFNLYWSVLCPTQPDYREEQLKYIAEVDRQSNGIWLNSQYFADQGHCNCARCQELYQKSCLSWVEWRRKVVTDYIAQIRDVVKKDLVLSLQPDPVSSLERYGVDFNDAAKYADVLNVVMFSKNYATPWYWEMLARGFKKILKKPMYVTLYVYGPGDAPQDVPTPSELLTVTARCARVGGIEGFIYLSDGEKEMRSFQKAALEKAELRQKLRSFGGKPVAEFLDRVENWKTITQ
jgi:glycosyltransferase involved in cell wall biosynthesis